MRYFHKQANPFWKPIINLDKVHSALPLTFETTDGIRKPVGEERLERNASERSNVVQIRD